jgi:hypothetical protein
MEGYREKHNNNTTLYMSLTLILQDVKRAQNDISYEI